MKGLGWGEYADGDYVVVGDEGSVFYGHIGIAKVRDGGETDEVHIGSDVLMHARKNLRRVRPGDCVMKVRP